MRFRRLLSGALFGAIIAGAAITTTALPGSVASAANATSAFVAMPTAQRLLDTRLATAVPAGGSVSVSVTGAAPLRPEDKGFYMEGLELAGVPRR